MSLILLIEDETLLRREMAEILQFEGYKVIEAENGAIGLKMALENLPDLILCDVMMPEMDGFEVLDALRDNPSTKLIPFIMITALGEREYVRSGMDSGADDYIVKPFKRKELLNALTSRLKKSADIRAHTESSLDDLRSKLIRSLPHELRTPLSGIIGFGQQLHLHPTNYSHQEISEFGGHIYNSGMRLYRLIQNYLLFAQMEMQTGQRPGEHVLHHVETICKSMAEEVALRFDRKNDLQLELKGASAMIGMQEFKKIVEELTDNAFKFSEPGSKVYLVCGLENDMLYLAVSDNGRGMTKDNIDKIGAYMQFDRDKHEQQGSGLGLGICQRIVTLFKGKLSFESKPGEGTLVRVTLPGKQPA